MPAATSTSTMPLTAPLGLEDVLRLARQYGAESVEMPDGLRVSMGPMPAAAEAAPSAPEAPAKAPCGHELYEQSDAGCLHGCPVPEAAP